MNGSPTYSPTQLQAGRRPRNWPSYRRYWLALYRRDVATATGIVERAARFLPARLLYRKFFAPALAMSGRLFAAGAIHWRDEHFITHHTLQLMRPVRRLLRGDPAAACGPLALAGGVGQESHLVGLRMVCDYLQAEGWRIRWVATHERGVYSNAVTAHQPAAVLLSVGREDALEPTRRLIAHLRRTGYDGLLVVGGRAVHGDKALARAAGADLTALAGPDLIRQLRRRLTR